MAVSSAAHDFLESTFEHPMLSVSVVSPQLFKTVPALAEARGLRVRLDSLHHSAAHCQRWQPMLVRKEARGRGAPLSGRLLT